MQSHSSGKPTACKSTWYSSGSSQSCGNYLLSHFLFTQHPFHRFWGMLHNSIALENALKISQPLCIHLAVLFTRKRRLVVSSRSCRVRLEVLPWPSAPGKADTASQAALMLWYPWEGSVLWGEQTGVSCCKNKPVQTTVSCVTKASSVSHRDSWWEVRTWPSSSLPTVLWLLLWSKTAAFSSFCWNVNISLGSGENKSWHCDFTGGNNSNR